MTLPGSSLATGTASTSLDPPVIRNGHLEAGFLPRAGGRMRYLRHADHGDLLIPLHDGSFNLEKWPKAGAFPLIPFHNRLHDAAFRYDGRLIRLRPNMENGSDAMHGPAHRRPWEITGNGPDYIEMAIDYRADEEWPFDFRASQRFELHESCLTIGLGLTNTGRAVMPGGIGWHPYFKPPRDRRSMIVAATRWNPAGPSGFPEPVSNETSTKRNKIAINVTHHFSDWTKTDAWLGDGARVTLSGSSELSCLVALRKREYICLEPTSHIAGAFATLSELSPATGLRFLRPGESLYGIAKLYVR